jgi:hypothetical protein
MGSIADLKLPAARGAQYDENGETSGVTTRGLASRGFMMWPWIILFLRLISAEITTTRMTISRIRCQNTTSFPKILRVLDGGSTTNQLGVDWR